MVLQQLGQVVALMDTEEDPMSRTNRKLESSEIVLMYQAARRRALSMVEAKQQGEPDLDVHGALIYWAMVTVVVWALANW